ncbi:hypothetical protein GmHk_03G007367 [Glycine max]|nr:hypothetical protein GmHk_03G007367 [Glycine max]
MRQFGYIQSIPAQPVDSWVSFDEIDDRWMHYSKHLAPADPSQDAPATHDASFVEPHIPQVPEPVAASTHARSNVDQPIHAVEACHAIAERLECLLNLRMVTEGTETHKVMEECIRIARGVTEDHIVYVRSRRRRRTDQL